MLTKSRFSFDSNESWQTVRARQRNVRFFIVEGDSAAQFQLEGTKPPLSGDPADPGQDFKCGESSMDKVLRNAEIKTIINAFGCAFRKDIAMIRYCEAALPTRSS